MAMQCVNISPNEASGCVDTSFDENGELKGLSIWCVGNDILLVLVMLYKKFGFPLRCETLHITTVVDFDYDVLQLLLEIIFNAVDSNTLKDFKLDLFSNEIDADELYETLNSCSKLTSLQLSKVLFDDSDFTNGVCGVISNMQLLQTLVIENFCFSTGEVMQRFLECLANIPALKHLVVISQLQESDDLSMIGAKDIADSFIGKRKSDDPVKIDFYYGDITQKSPLDMFAYIASSTAASNLAELIISHLKAGLVYNDQYDDDEKSVDRPCARDLDRVTRLLKNGCVNNLQQLTLVDASGVTIRWMANEST